MRNSKTKKGKIDFIIFTVFIIVIFIGLIAYFNRTKAIIIEDNPEAFKLFENYTEKNLDAKKIEKKILVSSKDEARKAIKEFQEKGYYVLVFAVSFELPEADFQYKNEAP